MGMGMTMLNYITQLYSELTLTLRWRQHVAQKIPKQDLIHMVQDTKTGSMHIYDVTILQNETTLHCREQIYCNH